MIGTQACRSLDRHRLLADRASGRYVSPNAASSFVREPKTRSESVAHGEISVVRRGRDVDQIVWVGARASFLRAILHDASFGIAKLPRRYFDANKNTTIEQLG